MKVRFLLPILAAIAACTTGEKVSDLHEGMTREQVEKILGKPDGFQRNGEMVQYQYTNRLISGWGWDRADYYAVFADDRLMQWGTGEVRQKAPPVSGVVVAPVGMQ